MIEEIKEALEKATPGPWKWIANGVCLFPERGQDYGDYVLFVQKSADLRKEDAHLISNTPTYIRYLLDELEKAQKENEIAQSTKEMLVNQIADEVKLHAKSCVELSLIRTEHAAMKSALEQISGYREILPSNTETYELAEAFLVVEDKASYVLSTLRKEQTNE